jgi:adenine phosphoribosyltransferase
MSKSNQMLNPEVNHLEKYKAYIHETADFPTTGVLFRDVSPLLADAKYFNMAIEDLLTQFNLDEVDAFVGVESRGFIFASAMALSSKKGFIPLRKAGKLPPPVLKKSYELEYGSATIEMKSGQGRVVIVDDVLATGGTLRASIELCEQSGYEVVDVGVFINLKFLNSMTFKDRSIKSLIQY